MTVTSAPDAIPVRGALQAGRALSDLTWLRVGGPADWLFQPADADDLSAFLAALDPAVPVFPMGVGSNLIVRDGGIRGVVVRLGRGFNTIMVEGDRVRAGAAALDAHVARRAAEAGRDLTFLRTIPGSIGGAVRMNAGCYGTYVADVLETVEVIRRDGRAEVLGGSVDAARDIDVVAVSPEVVRKLAIAAGGGGFVGIAGAVETFVSRNETVALAGAARLTAARDVRIEALSPRTIQHAAGTVAAGGLGGIAGTVMVIQARDRVIAATKVDLLELADRGEFRIVAKAIDPSASDKLRAASICVYMSASIACTIWKLAIGLPNCWRVLA